MSFSCYHPLKAFQVGTTESGKAKMKITPYTVDHVELVKGHWIAVDTHFRGSLAERVVTEFTEIPCGKCIACRLKYSKEWANRCMLELQYHDSAYFLTLTYNDEHVPVSMTDDGAASYTLVKRELQLFFKRLRKAFPNDNIRYYACGEYGDKTFRPHYHVIVYGLHLDDLLFYKSSVLKNSYYTSEKLQRVWSDSGGNGKRSPSPLGHVIVGSVSWESCAYTARYVMKKLKGDDAVLYEQLGIERPFVLMSRKPGIGHDYYDDHPDMYDYDYINISTSKGGKKFHPPKYFDRLLELDEPEKAMELKAERKRLAESAKRLKLDQTDLTYLELLSVEEAVHSSRIK